MYVLVSSVVTIRNMPSVVLLCAVHGFAASVSRFSDYFSEHYHAFRVCDSKEYKILITLNYLLFYKPFDLQSVYGSDDSMYVVLSHCLIA